MSFKGSVWDGSSSPLLSYVYSGHSYLVSNTPHASIPFSLFAIIHAVRIACAYRGVARAGGWDHRIGLFQAALVPLVLILGGTTITNVLMGAVPGWLISPIPVATYGLIPLIAAKSGITTLGVDSVLTHPNQALRTSPWAMILVATIAGGGGGMLVPTMKMFHADWGFDATPSWIKDGPSVDIWGATVIGYIYATLIDAHPFFRLLPQFVLSIFPFGNYFFHLPKNYASATGPKPLLPNNEAKILCSLILAGMLCTRTFYVYSNSIKIKSGSASTAEKAKKAITGSSSAASTPKSSSKVALKEKKTQ